MLTIAVFFQMALDNYSKPNNYFYSVIGGFLFILFMQIWFVSPAILLYHWTFETGNSIIKKISSGWLLIIKIEYIFLVTLLIAKLSNTEGSTSEILFKNMPINLFAAYFVMFIYEYLLKKRMFKV